MPRLSQAGDNFEPQMASTAGRRRDRTALRALLLGISSLMVAAASAHASSGGVATGSDGEPLPPGVVVTPPAAPTEFGSRVLRLGMQGEDVTVLNAIVKSKAYAARVQVRDVFEAPTAGAVKEFQRAARLRATGVVDLATSRSLVRSMSRAGASWYGPGFFGHRTACGTLLRQTTIGVASRALPCGTKVTLGYHGHFLVAPVIDRGPYAAGYKFDLTAATAQALRVTSSTDLRYAIARRGSDRRGL